MKKLIFAALLFLIAANTQAQNTKLDASGNYIAITHDANKEPGKETGKYFIDRDGVKYPVMESKTGKLYYIRISKKTNREYRAYLKL